MFTALLRAAVPVLFALAAAAGCTASSADGPPPLPEPAPLLSPIETATIAMDPTTNAFLIDAVLDGKRVHTPDVEAGETGPPFWVFEMRADNRKTTANDSKATVEVTKADYDLYRVGTWLVMRCEVAQPCTISGRRVSR